MYRLRSQCLLGFHIKENELGPDRIQRVGTLAEIAVLLNPRDKTQNQKFRRIPVIAWTPPDYADEEDQEFEEERKSAAGLTDWLEQRPVPLPQQAQKQLEEARKLRERDRIPWAVAMADELTAKPFCVRQDGIYFVNIRGPEEWLTAARFAFTRYASQFDPGSSDIDNDDPDNVYDYDDSMRTAISSLGREYLKLQRAVNDQRFKLIVEEKSGRRLYYDETYTEPHMLIEWSKMHPGEFVSVLQGPRYTNVAHAVFQRLHTKIRTWANELRRTSNELQTQWADSPSIAMLLNHMDSGHFFLVEMSPYETSDGLSMTQAYVRYSALSTWESQARRNPYSHADLQEGLRNIEINIVFRKSLLPTRTNSVPSEERLFLIVLHELAHLITSPMEIIQTMVAQEKWNRDMQSKITKEEEDILSGHGRLFCTTLQFNVNIAIRAGLLQSGEDWNIDNAGSLARKLDLNFTGEMTTLQSLETSLFKEGGIKRVRDYAKDPDSDEIVDPLDAHYHRILEHYIGAPLTTGHLRFLSHHWRSRNEEDLFIKHVARFAQRRNILAFF